MRPSSILESVRSRLPWSKVPSRCLGWPWLGPRLHQYTGSL